MDYQSIPKNPDHVLVAGIISKKQDKLKVIMTYNSIPIGSGGVFDKSKEREVEVVVSYRDLVDLFKHIGKELELIYSNDIDCADTEIISTQYSRDVVSLRAYTCAGEPGFREFRKILKAAGVPVVKE